MWCLQPVFRRMLLRMWSGFASGSVASMRSRQPPCLKRAFSVSPLLLSRSFSVVRQAAEIDRLGARVHAAVLGQVAPVLEEADAGLELGPSLGGARVGAAAHELPVLEHGLHARGRLLAQGPAGLGELLE